MAADRGYRFARLYTDAEHNDAAIAFYKANGYLCEPYLNQQDPACRQYPTLIFSKPLTGDALVPWNSRSIHLTEQIAKQQKQDFIPNENSWWHSDALNLRGGVGGLAVRCIAGPEEKQK